MTVYCMRLLRRIAAFCLCIFLLVGCAQPTGSIPNTALVEPALTVVENAVLVSGENAPANLQKNETVPVSVDDKITAAETGRGLIRFRDQVTVDLLRDSEFRIGGVETAAGDFLTVDLDHTKGHIRVKVDDNATARVRLVTSIATVTTTRPGTDYLICHNAVKLTCIVVLKGEVEVVGQDKLVTLEGGEATYVLLDNPPFPAICANLNEVYAWIDQKLGAGKVDPISALVASWDPISCAEAAARAALDAQQAQSTQGPALPAAEGMVQISAGTYTLGVDTPNANQVQTQTVALEEFWIDRFEVTNAQYQAFLDATGQPPPAVWPGGANQPVAGVTWNQAEMFCAWANKRLPDEAEWEAAARGSTASLFPWGDDTQAGGQINNLPRSSTYEVGTYTFNQSEYGVFDLAGNVWEWVGEPYAPVSEYSKVLRGGRYGLIKDLAHREQAAPNDPRYLAYAGFRCAADAVEGN